MSFSQEGPMDYQMETESHPPPPATVAGPALVGPPQCPYRHHYRHPPSQPMLFHPHHPYPAGPFNHLPPIAVAPLQPPLGPWATVAPGHAPHWPFTTASALYSPPAPAAGPSSDVNTHPTFEAASSNPASTAHNSRSSRPLSTWGYVDDEARYAEHSFQHTLSYATPPDNANTHAGPSSQDRPSDIRQQAPGELPTTPYGSYFLARRQGQTSSENATAGSVTATPANISLPRSSYVLPPPPLPTSHDGDYDQTRSGRGAELQPWFMRSTFAIGQGIHDRHADLPIDPDRTTRSQRNRRSYNRRNGDSRRWTHDLRPSRTETYSVEDGEVLREYFGDGPSFFHGLTRHGHTVSGLGDLAEEARRDRERFLALQRGARAAMKPIPTAAAIASLEKVAVDSLDEEERTCVICYNTYGEKNPENVVEQPLRLPKCKHVFGDVCIKRWFEDSDSCPYCREKLPSEVPNPHRFGRPWAHELMPPHDVAAYAVFLQDEHRARREADRVSSERRRRSEGLPAHSSDEASVQQTVSIARDMLEARRRGGRGARGVRALTFVTGARASPTTQSSGGMMGDPMTMPSASRSTSNLPNGVFGTSTLAPIVNPPTHGARDNSPAIFNHSPLPNNGLRLPSTYGGTFPRAQSSASSGGSQGATEAASHMQGPQSTGDSDSDTNASPYYDQPLPSPPTSWEPPAAVNRPLNYRLPDLNLPPNSPSQGNNRHTSSNHWDSYRSHRRPTSSDGWETHL